MLLGQIGWATVDLHRQTILTRNLLDFIGWLLSLRHPSQHPAPMCPKPSTLDPWTKARSFSPLKLKLQAKQVIFHRKQETDLLAQLALMKSART